MDNLETHRTKLRRFKIDDLENMIQLESDPQVVKFTPMRVPLTREQSEARLKASIAKQKELAPLGVWAAEKKETGEFIGWFMLAIRKHEFPELGFMIVNKFWGKGYTTEIAQRLIDFGLKELNYPGIVAVTDEGNHASKRVLHKLGFQFIKQETSFDNVQNKEIHLEHFELKK